MATTIPEGALKYLHDDFVRLSSEIRKAPCVFNWVKRGETISKELREFVAIHNDVRFSGFAETIERFDKERQQIIGKRAPATGVQ